MPKKNTAPRRKKQKKSSATGFFQQPAKEHMDHASQARAKSSLTDTKIFRTAAIDSFRKLHPRTMVKNPVMFVVEVGALLTSIQLVRDSLHHAGAFGFGLQITL